MARLPSPIADAVIRTRIDSMLPEVITRASKLPGPKPSSRALLGFLVRCAGSWKSLNILIDSSKTGDEANAIGNDCAAILRCMYDAHIQAAYLAADGSKRDELGRLYLDYVVVERYQRANEVVGRNNPFSQHIASSPLRAQGEKRNKTEFERVKVRYPRQKRKAGRQAGSSSVRNTWYEGNLRELAKVIGKEDEYVVFVKMLHGSIHSGPHAVFNGPPIRGPDFRVFAATLVCRVARLVLDNDSIKVTSDSHEIIDAFLADPLEIA